MCGGVEAKGDREDQGEGVEDEEDAEKPKQFRRDGLKGGAQRVLEL